ncbi:MAG: hypothetical protein DRI48_09690 [Chloroflexi bacterium]|nr:MAG: hypothetical protein DRI48_09690 [Chloroflexota bacterium]
MNFDVYYAAQDQTDFTPPAIWEVEGLIQEDRAAFRVLAQDDAGVERVVVSYSTDGESWHSLDLAYDGDSGYWQGQLSGLSGKVRYFVQAVDRAGNVSMSTNKGLFFEPEEHTIYLPLVLRQSSGR